MIHVMHYGLSPYRGGIETYLDRIFANINKEEYCFSFVDEWDEKAFFRDKFMKNGAAFFDITPRRKSLKKNKNEWENLLTEHRPDILHCHMNTLSYITPVLTALKANVPVIVHSRNAGTIGSLHTSILHAINKRRLKQCRIYRLAVSAEAGQWLFGKNGNVIVLHNCVDIDKFCYNAEKRKIIREQLKIEGDEYLVGTVASLSAQKNQYFLVEIMRSLRHTDEKARLAIVGEGDLRECLQKQITEAGLEESVHLIGEVDNVPDYLCAFDVFILPSFYEGFPNSVLEAQTSGLPCLLSDTITKEVDIGNCRYLSLKEKPVVWATALEDMKELNRNRESGIQKIADMHLTTQDEIQDLEQIYKSIVSNGKMNN